jgi:hypothetical protein
VALKTTVLRVFLKGRFPVSPSQHPLNATLNRRPDICPEAELGAEVTGQSGWFGLRQPSQGPGFRAGPIPLQQDTSHPAAASWADVVADGHPRFCPYRFADELRIVSVFGDGTSNQGMRRWTIQCRAACVPCLVGKR